MTRTPRLATWRRWTVLVPIGALVTLIAVSAITPGSLGLTVVGLMLAGSVPAAVYHAELLAHRVGEPLGALVLAIAVTVIEVGLIITLTLDGKGDTSTLARDTVFAAVMLACNAVFGAAVLAGALRSRVATFNTEGTASALATVLTLAGLSLVLPTFTTSRPGPEFSAGQLAFAATASLGLYALFVFVQTIRHPEDFADLTDADDLDHHGRPSKQAAVRSLVLLVVALVAVVGLAKVASPAIESAVSSVGAPKSAVGVVIAVLVLMPEGVAAVRSARRGRVQTSLNLALGSAMASIGLTIPAIAISSIWLDGRLVLGLGPTQIVLLTLTAVVGSLTVLPGKATVQQAAVHLALAAAFVFLALHP